MMEGVPRLYMLSFDLKVSPPNSDFSTPLKKYIRTHYQEDPETYNKEIKDIESLRHSACKVPQDFTGCSILKRYYSQLLLLQNRFPMTDDGPACVPFTWTDIYSGATFTITDIKYEQACILYNIGALHSQLGAMDPRSNADGMKMACTHFQCASWAFQHLRDTYPQPKGSDLSHSILSFKMNVMLAQAQECILEKSMLDNRKSSITAKVAIQVVDYYRSALKVLVSSSPSKCSIFDVVNSKLYKTWQKYIEFKMSYYTSISHYFMGNQCEEQQKMGERVSWFQSASEHLNEAIKLGKSMDRDDVNESLSFLLDIIGGKHSVAKKENDFVYHEKVLPTDGLPEIKGASLVKGISFNPTDPDVCGADVFSRLVPMEAHSSSSVYSEEKAKILRSVSAKIEEKNEALSTFMSSLHLDQDILKEEEEDFPPELMEKCAALSVKPTALTDLLALMNDLTDTSNKVESDIATCKNLLSNEEQKEAEHQEIFGKRAPSMILVDLKKECSKLEEAHKKAANSNKLVQDVVSSHSDNMKLLLGPAEEVVKRLPSVKAVKSNIEGTVLEDYQKLINKVEEMQKQRKFLEDQLREALQNDDITRKIVAADKKENLEQIFQEELKKHDQTLTYIDQNLAAQDNILRALTDTNASFADVRKSLITAKQERDFTIQSLIASYEAYEDLMDKAQKGLEFYQKLKSNVSRILDRIKSVTRVQEEERMQRVSAQKIPAGGIPFTAQNSTKAPAAPKLKDYLPFMTGQKLPATSAPGVPLSQAPHAIPQAVPYQSAKTMPQVPLPTNVGISSDPSVVLPSGQAITSRAPVVPPPLPISVTAPVQVSGPQGMQSTDGRYPVQVPSTVTNYSSGSHPYYSKGSATAGMPYGDPVCTMPANYVNSTSVKNISNTPASHPQSFNTALPATQPNVPAPYSNMYPLYNTNAQYTGYPGSSSVNVAQSNLSPISATTVSSVPYNQFPQAAQNAMYPGPQPASVATSGMNYSHPSVNMFHGSQPVASRPSLQPSGNVHPNSQASKRNAYPVPQTNAVNSHMPANMYPSAQPGMNSQLPPSMYSAPQAVFNEYPGMYQKTQIPPNVYQHPQTNVQPIYSDVYQGSQSLPTSYAISQTGASVHPTVMGAVCRPDSFPAAKYSTQGYSLPPSNFPNVYSASGASPSHTYPVVSTYSVSSAANVPNAGNYTNVSQMAYPPGARVVYTTGVSVPNAQAPVSSLQAAPVQPPPSKNGGLMNEDSMPAPQLQPLTPVPVASEGESVNKTAESRRASSASLINGKPEVPVQSSGVSLSNSAHDLSTSGSINVLQNNLDVLHMKDLEKQNGTKPKVKDPLDDPVVLARFAAEEEKFEKLVEGLVRKSLNGTVPLDQKWKDLAIAEDKDCRKMSISVARCYPLKNRVPDIMPYDHNRVELLTCKDDYINASYLKDLVPSGPTFIITQAPLPSTYSDFWMMVWEQQVENIVCLVSSTELKNHIYWPEERGKNIMFGPLEVSLQTQKGNSTYSERIISISHKKNKTSRVVVHLQFNVWPPSKLPNVNDLLQFVATVLNFYKQQRNSQRPLVVHCSAGVGRSGAFCLILALASEMNKGQGPRDVAQVAARMFQQRKFVIHDKDHLKFCYHTVLCFAQKLLKQKGMHLDRPLLDAKSLVLASQESSGEVDSLAKIHSSLSNLGLEDMSLLKNSLSVTSQSATNSESKEEDSGKTVTDLPPDQTEASEHQENQDLPTGDQTSVDSSTVAESCDTETESSNETPNTVSGDSSVTAVLDPTKFTLDSKGSSKRRITKDMFTSSTGNLCNLKADASDPFGDLDPMWSLKK